MVIPLLLFVICNNGYSGGEVLVFFLTNTHKAWLIGWVYGPAAHQAQQIVQKCALKPQAASCLAYQQKKK